MTQWQQRYRATLKTVDDIDREIEYVEDEVFAAERLQVDGSYFKAKLKLLCTLKTEMLTPELLPA